MSERGESPATVGELEQTATARQADDSADCLSADPIQTRAMCLERERALGRLLGLQVAIDNTGWLRREIEVVFTKAPNGTIQPITVRVGDEAGNDDVLAHGGVSARCDEYNAAIGKLHQLAEYLATMVRDGTITLEPGSPVAYAHGELSRLDELIEQRQRITMGHGTVQLATLRRELEFFQRYDAHMAPIVHAAARVASAARPRNAPPARRARRWLPW